ncbi:TetR family transcriptional regulator [Pseudomonas resinovorans]|uniref:TetR family transcriptional regulator n=1 Tax=Metapseudomonas resinovorans TaxID=53412 RepID=UPI00237FD510|nr:TetR family transcriptional regulator [Pseudomonas resinovorans]MDE3735826.1 TetR family transcriptional regulator [Pseudomonas resinovorans]
MNSVSGDEHQSPERATDAPGKRLLMEAALRLGSQSRSLSNLGLRELAREAGLNPNTFYRHFKDVDDLGLAIIRTIATQLRQPLRDLRREAAARAVQGDGGVMPKLLGIDLGRGRRVCHETVQLFFDFVDDNTEAFVIGVRELHGASPVLREALREVMEDFAADMAEDVREYRLLPALVAEPVVRRVSRLVSRNLFQMSLDYIGEPERREAIRAEAEEQVLFLFTGASVLQAVRAV